MGLGFKSNADGSGGSITSNQIPVIDIDNTQKLSVKEELTLEKGVLVFDKVDGGKLNLKTPNGTEVTDLVLPESGAIYNSATVDTLVDNVQVKFDNHIPLSGVCAYHLLAGNLAVSNSTITQGFNTTLYTSGSTVTGIDMDTQWGNTAEEKFGGLVWLKDRVEVTNNFLYDTIRGSKKEINTNTTEAETTLAEGLTGFASTGFTVGNDAGHNSTTNNMVSWNFQTTHRVSGTTNHGKAIVNHYNPFTGFGIAVYTGSGIAGHDIQTMLGRKVAFATIKNLSAVSDWLAQYRENNYMYLNLTNAETSSNTVITNLNDNSMTLGISATCNTLNQQYVVYYWANSYLDESNKLIGNYELVTYQGTGVAGNKVKTKGKPAWVMIKRVDSADGSGWIIKDNLRNGFTTANSLFANATAIETLNGTITNSSDGFITNDIGSSTTNTPGGQYIALVAYDTNSNGGGSYYPLASDTANVQINNALIPLAQGIDSNGVKNTILSKNETITGLTYTAGKNYVYCDKNGNYGVTPYKPRYLESDLIRTFASEAPEYYDVAKNKWFRTSGQGELVTNGTGLSLTGWTGKDVNSGFPDSILSLSNQTIVITNSSTAGSNGGAYQLLTGLTVGKKYKVKLSQDGTVQIQVGITSYLANVRYATSSVGATEFEFIAQATSIYLTFYNSVGTANDSCWIDNVTCFATDIVPTTEITNSRNYLNHIVHADNDGGVLYVEELPKIEYKDNLKVNTLYADKLVVAGIDASSWETAELTNTGAKFKDGTLKFRVPNVRYYNTKEYEMKACVTISGIGGGNTGAWYGVVDGITVSIYQFYVGTTASGAGTLWLTIPPGSSYYFTGCTSWAESR